MTCITGVVGEDGVFIGSDSCLTWGSNERTLLPHSKIVEVGDLVIGIAGEAKGMNALLYGFSAPPRAEDVTNIEYIYSSLIAAIQQRLRDLKMDDIIDKGGVQFLVGYRGRLYRGGSYGGIFEVPAYSAIGSGSDYALGSLYTTSGEQDSEARVRKALEAAAAFDPGVAGPFYVVKVPELGG